MRKLISLFALLTAPLLIAQVCVSPNGPFNPSSPASSGFGVIFSDTFPGTTLNTSNWCPNYPSAPSCADIGNSTNSNQQSCLDPANVTVSGNAVHLALTGNACTDWAGDNFPTTGAAISTCGPQTGTCLHVFEPPATSTGAIWIEIQLGLPAVTGTEATVANEPSTWLNGVSTTSTGTCTAGWPNCGEIDFAEFYTGSIGPGLVGGDCTSYHHDPDDYELALSVVGPVEARTTCTGTAYPNLSGIHYYGVLWTATSISFYVDRIIVFTTTNVDAPSPMYLNIFNIWDTRTTQSVPSTIDVYSVYVWSHS